MTAWDIHQEILKPCSLLLSSSTPSTIGGLVLACSHAGVPVIDATMEAAGQLGLFFEGALEGDATLSMGFSYALALGDTGFHLDEYAAADGARLLYGATHMEVWSGSGPQRHLS